MVKQVIQLTGHSGCDLFLTNQGGKLIVRKEAGQHKYNSRLRKQCVKQKMFVNSEIYAPTVLSHGYKDGLFFFNMDFIEGKTLAEYMSSILITEISEFIHLIFENISTDLGRIIPLTREIFISKILELRQTIKVKNKIILHSLNILENYHWRNIYNSPCHGDLTLENIIITKDKAIFLIDFLDSFYDSWMIDVAKLFQDLEVKWSFRNKSSDQNRDLRILVAKDALTNTILSLQGGKELLRSIYHILLLNLLRIIPYTIDKNTIRFLNISISRVVDTINQCQEGE